MAIFDANKKMYLTFYCQLHDPVAIDTTVTPVPVGFPSGAETSVAALQAAFPRGMNTAPLLAASLLEAPFRGYSDPGDAPTVWAPWNSFGNDDGPYPINVSKFRRHTGGFLGIGGTTVDYYWMGEFVEAPAGGEDGDGDITDGAGVPVAPGSIAEFPLRHFLEGFECPGLGIGQAGATSGLGPGATISPDASRHVGGLGLALRGPSNEKFAVSIAAPPKTKIWNRLYVRLRKAPTTQVVDFWRYTGASVQVGFILALNPNRTLTIWSSDAAAVRTLQHQSSDALCELWDGDPANPASWVRLDILAITAGTTSIRVYKNGVLFATATGVASGAFINTVVVGNAAVQVNDLYMDLDDWVSADIPERPVGTENLTGIDFRQGSKIARLAPQAFAGSHAAASWTTDFRSLIARGLGLVTPSGQVTGSVSGAVLAVDTDSDLSVDADAGTIGLIAIEAITESNSSDGSDGSLGFTLAGGAPIMTVIPEIPAFGVNRAMYTVTPSVTGAGLAPTLPDSTPIVLRYTKAASVATAVVRSLQAQIELIGVYGPEDRQDQDGAAYEQQSVGCHNFPYKYSPWSRLGAAAPIAPYIVKSGTYVGNGTGQDLTFRAPVNWLYIRPLASNTGGTMWWSSMIGCVRNFKEGIEYDIVDAQEDPTFIGAPGEDAQQQRYRVRIGGNDDQNNQAAITYWYVAVSDPGMRYMHNGVMNHDDSVASFDNKLVNDSYTPEWAFIFSGDDSLVATRRLYGKGPGNAAATIVNFDSSLGALAAALTFGLGKLTTQTAFHALGSATGNYYPFALWRKHDGNNDTGEPKVVNIGTYTGDGSASRTINLAPAAGVRPLFAMFFAESGASRGYHRDTQHTGSNSSLYTGVENTTGITGGGIDQISVGSSLNVAGVIYNYFVLWAGTTAGNNGWGTDGEYAPVEPAPPVGGPWPPDPEPGDLGDYVPPVVPLPGEPDIDTGTILSDSATMIWGQVGGSPCETYTRALVNRAFKHLGISKRIADLNTDATEAGYTARDNVREVMNQVLRDFPWPFATQYSDLVLVGGTAAVAVNKDWQYSYRGPNQLMMARRIVSQSGTQRAHDPDPIKFRISTDATGVLVYCNEPIPTDGTLVLEWTKRLNCPAFYGDPLFREAVAWKLAASMAMPLARDTKKEAFCLGMYRQALWNAATPASNEQQQEPEGDASWIEGRN